MSDSLLKLEQSTAAASAGASAAPAEMVVPDAAAAPAASAPAERKAPDMG